MDRFAPVRGSAASVPGTASPSVYRDSDRVVACVDLASTSSGSMRQS